MKITKRHLRRIIREAVNESQWQDNIDSYMEEREYGDFAKTAEVKAALVAAGFNADGSFGMDGYLGPDDWGMYSPKNMEEAEGWIDAAIEMNDALRQAETALDRGEFQSAQDAWHKIVYPVQLKWSKHGASDTEGREAAGEYLERAGFEW